MLELPFVLSEKKDVLETGKELSHFHEGIELICVLDGEFICQTNASTFELVKSDVCFINNMQLHRLAKKDQSPAHCLTLEIKISTLAKLKDYYEKFLLSFIDNPLMAHVKLDVENKSTKEIYNLIESLSNLYKEKPYAFEFEIVADVFLIIRHLTIALLNSKNEKESYDSNVALLRHMISFIEEHYFEDIMLDDIAEYGNVSLSKCSRLFKQYTSLSPVTYLIDYRLHQSRIMLQESDDSISTISLACGFTQQSHFGKMFLRAFGKTPREYRSEKKTEKEHS